MSPVPSLCGWTPCRCEVRRPAPAPAPELREPLSFPERQVTGSILVGVFVLCPPVPGPKLLSPLGFPGRWGVFCSDEVTLGGTGAPERPGHGLKLGIFRHPPLQSSREGGGAAGGGHDGSCICDEASIKISEVWGSGRFSVSESTCVAHHLL